MPAALDVDREQVRMLVVSVGCSEAARQTGINLNTVLQWSARFGWLKALQVKPVLPASMQQPAIGVISGANAQANVVREKLMETRENHLDTTLAVSRKMKALPVKKWLTKDGAQTLYANIKASALVGGWNADSRPDSPGKAFGGRNSGLEIDVETLESEPAEPVAEMEAGPSMDVNDY